MSIEFLRPLFLLLAALAPLVWFYPRRASGTATKILRSLALLLIVVALAQPVVVVNTEQVHHVLIVDGSAGLSSAARARADEFSREWRARVGTPSQAVVVRFGDDQSADSSALEGITTIRVRDEHSSSPVGAALDAALRHIPHGSTGAVTLLTDGLATDRRWGAAVRQLVERGIPVKTIDLTEDNEAVRAVRVSTPPRMHVGQTVQLVVDVAGRARRLVVRLNDREGRELARSSVFTLEDRASVALEFEPSEAGFLDVQAEVLDASSLSPVSAHHALSTTLAIQAPLRLLYLGSRVTAAAPRLGELLGRGFEVTDGSTLPLGATTDLRAFDLAVIDDRPANELPQDFQASLATAVRRDGLGLLYAGGKASFGAGGYDGSPIADLLPVDIVQRAEKQDPSTALALIIDTSGSMRGTRMELAKQVARLAVRRLKAHDRVGLVEFYGNKHWTLPLQSAANKIAIERAIGRMQASGGTVMYPGIEEAYYGLKNVSTRFKHILIITDAGVEDADYESLIRAIARDNINVSTVLVGAQAHSKSLIDIANWGNGRFYAAADRFALPEILLKQATTTNLPSYKEGSFPTSGRGGRTWWSDIESDTVPALAAYVETQTRPGAEVLIDVEGAGHPVLATWQSGAGRVTALMTEPLGPGASSWREWPAYGRWLARIASRTAGEQLPFRFEIARRDHQVLVTARATTTDRTLTPQAFDLGLSDSGRGAVAFSRVAPDRFEARFTLAPDNAIRLAARAVDAAGSRIGPETLLVSTARADIAPEHQVDPADALPLQELAQLTGGMHQMLTTAEFGELPRPVSSRGANVVELWVYAALLALLVYLSEILCRRWPDSTFRLSVSASRT